MLETEVTPVALCDAQRSMFDSALSLAKLLEQYPEVRAVWYHGPIYDP